MSTRGKSYAPVFICERVAEVVATLDSIFSLDEVVKTLAVTHPEISRASVNTCLNSKVSQGVLVKAGTIYEKIPNTTFVRHTPRGVIAEALWDILLKERAKPQRKDDLIAETECRVAKTMNKKCADCLAQVGNLLKSWSDNGYLRHFGGWGNNSYQILPGITERPPVVYR